MEPEYHALTIDYYNGKPYWNQVQRTLDDVHKHLERYCQRRCHVFIFTKMKEHNGLRLVKQIKDYNAPER